MDSIALSARKGAYCIAIEPTIVGLLWLLLARVAGLIVGIIRAYGPNNATNKRWYKGPKGPNSSLY